MPRPENEIISPLFVSESGTLIDKAGPNLNSDVQVETDIQRGLVEFYYDALKAIDVDSDSDADYPFEFDMMEEFREIK